MSASLKRGSSAAFFCDLASCCLGEEDADEHVPCDQKLRVRHATKQHATVFARGEHDVDVVVSDVTKARFSHVHHSSHKCAQRLFDPFGSLLKCHASTSIQQGSDATRIFVHKRHCLHPMKITAAEAVWYLLNNSFGCYFVCISRVVRC